MYHIQKSAQNGLVFNLRPETIKLIEENIAGKLLDICLSDFFNMTSKAGKTKAKINEWDYIKIRFCTAKETINKMKKQYTEWENVSYI